MPRATVLKTSTRYTLTTLPAVDDDEAGWIELRRMSFGEKLAKDSEAMKMRFGLDLDSKDVDAELSMVNVVATLLEFSKCVVDHNLLDDNGNKLNFGKPDDIRALDPRVGDEIATLIGELNDFEKAATRNTVDAVTGKS